jgi:hypothetical protein
VPRLGLRRDGVAPVALSLQNTSEIGLPSSSSAAVARPFAQPWRLVQALQLVGGLSVAQDITKNDATKQGGDFVLVNVFAGEAM